MEVPGTPSSIRSAGFVLLPDRSIRESLHQRARARLLSSPAPEVEFIPARRLLLPLLLIHDSAHGIELGAVRAAAASIRSIAFEIAVDRVLFSRVGMHWGIALRQIPPGLANLRTALDHALLAQHTSFPTQPWQPLMPLTAATSPPVDPTPRTFESLTWTAAEFLLVQTRITRFGPILETIDAWPLQS